MMTSEETLEDIRTGVAVTGGRLEITADGQCDVSIHTADLTPLSSGEVLASIRINGDDYNASIALDGNDINTFSALCDELRNEEQRRSPVGPL